MDYFEGSDQLDELDEFLPDATFCPCCGMYLTGNPDGVLTHTTKTVKTDRYDELNPTSYQESGNYIGSRERIELHTVCPRCKSDFKIVYRLRFMGSTTKTRKRKDQIESIDYYPEFDMSFATYSYKTITKEKEYYEYALRSASIVCEKDGQKYFCEYDKGENRWFTKQELTDRNVKKLLETGDDLVKRATKLLEREHSVSNFDKFEEMYRELQDTPCWIAPAVDDLLKQYTELVEELLPAFKEKRKKQKERRRKLRKVTKIAKRTALVCAITFVVGATINEFIPNEDLNTAVVNTEYTGLNKGASWDHKYEFTLDEPGILTPNDDTRGWTIWSKDNLYIFKADDDKAIVYDKWLKGGADSVYLDKGDYIALITPGGIIDYSRKGYSFILNFQPLKKSPIGKTIEVNKVYDDKLTSEKDVNTYKITTSASTTLNFQTNKPIGEYTGKASLFDNKSKSTNYEQSYFNITVEDEDGKEIENADVTLASWEVRLPGSIESSKTYTIKISAVNYSPDTYTFFVAENK